MVQNQFWQETPKFEVKKTQTYLQCGTAVHRWSLFKVLFKAGKTLIWIIFLKATWTYVTTTRLVVRLWSRKVNLHRQNNLCKSSRQTVSLSIWHLALTDRWQLGLSSIYIVVVVVLNSSRTSNSIRVNSVCKLNDRTSSFCTILIVYLFLVL